MEKINYQNEIKVSKTMSWILRFGINELGLEIDEKGRIPLEVLLGTKQMKDLDANEQIVRNIVETNDKKRFNLEQVNGTWLIGANQGHSKSIGSQIDNTKLMEQIYEPIVPCVHGTYKKNISLIKETGLKCMGRTHIHFASGYPDDSTVISGARNSANVFVELDMEKALADGMYFYRSANGVILTEGFGGTIEPKYFSKIVYK